MPRKIKKSLWFNKYSIFSYIGMILVIFTWFIFKMPKTIKIASAIVFLVAEILVNIKNKDIRDTTFFRFVNWLALGIMLIFTIIYIAVSVGEIDIAIFLILASFFAFILISTIFSVIGIFKSKRVLGIVISYAILSFLIITVFGFIFTIISVNNNKLFWTNTEKSLESPWDYIYFSSSMYYANSVGDITPTGYNKTIMQIESAISFIFHIIILGFIITNLNKQA